MTNKFKVRDLRKKTQFKIDDEYLNGYARICGVFATAVYNSLSRHADFVTQECFPSVELIAEQHGISKPSVFKSLKILQTANIISKKRLGKMKSNEYVLIDKSEWLPKEELRALIDSKNKRGSKNKRDKMGRFEGEVNDMDITSEVNVTVECSKRYGASEVNDMDTKDNTWKDNTYKVCAKTSLAKGKSFNPLGAEILKEFELVDPKNKTYYGNKTQRAACDFLIDEYGLERVKSVIAALPVINQKKLYLRQITSPYELKENWVKIANALKQNQEIKNQVAFS